MAAGGATVAGKEQNPRAAFGLGSGAPDGAKTKSKRPGKVPWLFDFNPLSMVITTSNAGGLQPQINWQANG